MKKNELAILCMAPAVGVILPGCKDQSVSPGGRGDTLSIQRSFCRQFRTIRFWRAGGTRLCRASTGNENG